MKVSYRTIPTPVKLLWNWTVVVDYSSSVGILYKGLLRDNFATHNKLRIWKLLTNFIKKKLYNVVTESNIGVVIQ